MGRNVAESLVINNTRLFSPNSSRRRSRGVFGDFKYPLILVSLRIKIPKKNPIIFRNGGTANRLKDHMFVLIQSLC
jgi:hypothetical protein